MLDQTTLGKEWRKERRVLRSVQWRVKVASAPNVLDLQVVRVERVHLEEYGLCLGPHVANHVQQTLDLATECFLVLDGQRGVVAMLEDVAVEHVLDRRKE